MLIIHPYLQLNKKKCIQVYWSNFVDYIRKQKNWNGSRAIMKERGEEGHKLLKECIPSEACSRKLVHVAVNECMIHQHWFSKSFTWEHINANWKFFICRKRRALILASAVSPVQVIMKWKNFQIWDMESLSKFQILGSNAFYPQVISPFQWYTCLTYQHEEI